MRGALQSVADSGSFPLGLDSGGPSSVAASQSIFAAVDTGSMQVEPVRILRTNWRIFERIMIDGFEFEEMRGAAAGTLLQCRRCWKTSVSAHGSAISMSEPVAGAASMMEAGIVDVVMVATLPARAARGWAGGDAGGGATRAGIASGALFE